MAKTFYSASEAAEKLERSEDDLKALVREGKLREFRDAGKVNYRVSDVDALVESSSPGGDEPILLTPADSDPGGSASSASGEIILEPMGGSGIDLVGSGSDILSLESEDSSAGTRAAGKESVEKKKEGTVVPSVGVNVFDDDELDEVVDPLAQTAVTDVGGLGLEGIGSGSGILDLTRESDDTSLGEELLEEIYTDESGDGGADAGDDTRAGLDDALTEESEEGDDVPLESGTAPAHADPRKVSAVPVVEAAPDAVSAALTALMVVGVAVMWFAGLAGVSLVRGISPSLLETVRANMVLCVGGAALVAGLAAGITYFLAKRSG